jgi:hypothetical protein
MRATPVVGLAHLDNPSARGGEVLIWEGELSMDFRPLNDTERRQLINALRGNAESDRAILMDRRDTSFLGSADEVTDEEVISAIKSVPCHY